MTDISLPIFLLALAIMLYVDPRSGSRGWRVFKAAVLVAMGGYFLSRMFFDFRIFAPISLAFGTALEVLTALLLIVAGVVAAFRSGREAPKPEAARS
jgi:hypothetical protein